MNAEAQMSEEQMEESVLKNLDWKNPPKLGDLQEDLRSCETSHANHVAEVKLWLDFMNATGQAAIPKRANRSSVVPQVIRKQAEWRYSSLSEPFLNTKKVFEIKPTTAMDVALARQSSFLLNYQFNKQMDKQEFIDEYVRTAVDEGTVIVRVGWNYKYRTEKVEKQVFEYVVDTSFEQNIAELSEMKQKDPARFKELPEELKMAWELSQEQKEPIRPVPTGETEIVEETETLANHPTAEVCNYNNIRIDPTCEGNLKKAKFIIYSYESCLADLKADGSFTNLDQIRVSDNSPLADPDHESSNDETFTFKDDPRKKLVVYEYWGYWDVNGDGNLTAFKSSWVGNTMIELTESPYSDNELPFVKVQYLPRRKQIYGQPDGVLLQDNQRIIGALTRGMIDIMGKSAAGQRSYRTGSLDPTNRRKMMRGEDFEFNGQGSPDTIFHQYNFPEIPQSVPLLVQQMNNEAESLTGVKAFNQGISGQSLGEVAAGVRGALDASSKRELGILRRLARGIEEIGRKFLSMSVDFLDEEEIFQVTDEEVVVIQKDKLDANADLELSISTAEESNAQVQDLAFILQTVGPNAPAGMTNLIMAEILELKKKPGLAKEVREYKPEPDPLVVKEQELRIQLLQEQIEEVRSRVAENYAQAQNYKAKAEETSSNRDLKDLEHLERESGVTQERAKEIEALKQAGKANNSTTETNS